MALALTAVAVGAALLVGTAAQAASSAAPTAIDIRIRKFGEMFAPMAEKFGMSHFGKAGRNESGVVMYEFLPSGEVLGEWNLRASVMVLPVGTTLERGREVLPKYIGAFQKATDGREMLEREQFETPYGPVAFTEYRDISGKGKEHNFSMIWQVMPGQIANFQLQSRGRRFGPGVREAFRTMAQNMHRAGGVSAPEPEPKHEER